MAVIEYYKQKQIKRVSKVFWLKLPGSTKSAMAGKAWASPMELALLSGSSLITFYPHLAIRQREYNTQAGPPASMPSHSDPLPPGGSHSFLKPGTQCENKQA